MQPPMTDALGTSEVFLTFQEGLRLLAAVERPVLVLGERGTGKELAVQRLHYFSARWEKPLVTVLCPALSPTLLESELFGHEAGAFTGARGRRTGFFERADGGTLFLDEVADMSLPLQDKLLRVIEYGGFERVGGTASVRVDVRVVAATNRDLPALVRAGTFRADLLDRLAFDVLHVPPLRVRGEDKLLLARHFASGMAAELFLAEKNERIPVDDSPSAEFGPVFGPAALEQLETYAWPGNVRELRNVVERTVAHRRSLLIDSLDIDPFASPYEAANVSVPVPLPLPALPRNDLAAATSLVEGSRMSRLLPSGFSLPQELKKREQEWLSAALEQASFRQKEAARLLGLTYDQFRVLYRKHGVSPKKRVERDA